MSRSRLNILDDTTLFLFCISLCSSLQVKRHISFNTNHHCMIQISSTDRVTKRSFQLLQEGKAPLTVCSCHYNHTQCIHDSYQIPKTFVMGVLSQQMFDGADGILFFCRNSSIIFSYNNGMLNNMPLLQKIILINSVVLCQLLR